MQISYGMTLQGTSQQINKKTRLYSFVASIYPDIWQHRKTGNL
jgi:hypothetical protein